MMKNKVVYIASPYAGDTQKNIEFARRACLHCIAEGHVPLAPHLLYTQMLDDSDPAQREAGLGLGLRLLERADELWICGGSISSGMAAEIEKAERLGIPIRRPEIQSICTGNETLRDRVVCAQAGMRMVTG